jgi:hypothetical protein
MTTPFLGDINDDGVVRGRPYQEVGEISELQQYPIGMILERHGRRYRYSKAYEAITITNRGCPSMVEYPWIATSVRSAKFVSCNAFVAGDRKITLTVDDVIEDTSPYAALTKNFFTGGFINCFFDTNAIQTIRVSGNEIGVAAAANTAIVLYLDEPFAKDYAAGCTVDLYASPYIAVGASSSLTGWASVAVIPHVAVTSGYFFWGQTKGVCWVTPTSGIVGTTIRMTYFHSDGTVKDAGTDTSLQMAGPIIYKGDNTQDDCTIQLMLE